MILLKNARKSDNCVSPYSIFYSIYLMAFDYCLAKAFDSLPYIPEIPDGSYCCVCLALDSATSWCLSSDLDLFMGVCIFFFLLLCCNLICCFTS